MISAAPYRFKYRQNTPFTVLVFIFSAVPNRLKCLQSEPYTVPVFVFSFTVPNRPKYRQNELFTVPVFNFYLCSFKSCSLYRLYFLRFFCSSKSFQMLSECTVYRPRFICFSAVPNYCKYRQNEPCTIFILIFSVVHCFRCRQNASFTVLVVKISLQIIIVSNAVRVHHLASLSKKM